MITRSAIVAFLLAGPALAQEKVFDFNGITNIEVRNGITVNIIQGDTQSIVGTARSGNVENFRLQRFGDWLAVNRNTRWFIFPYGRQDDLVLTVTVPDIRALKAYDAASVTAAGFTGDRIRAEALDGGTITLTDLSFAEVSVYATDEGKLTVTGICDLLDVEAITSAHVDAAKLACIDAKTTTLSDGSITASASGLALIDDSAGGTITLSGGAQIVDALPETETED